MGIITLRFMSRTLLKCRYRSSTKAITSRVERDAPEDVFVALVDWIIGLRLFVECYRRNVSLSSVQGFRQLRIDALHDEKALRPPESLSVAEIARVYKIRYVPVEMTVKDGKKLSQFIVRSGYTRQKTVLLLVDERAHQGSCGDDRDVPQRGEACHRGYGVLAGGAEENVWSASVVEFHCLQGPERVRTPGVGELDRQKPASQRTKPVDRIHGVLDRRSGLGDRPELVVGEREDDADAVEGFRYYRPEGKIRETPETQRRPEDTLDYQSPLYVHIHPNPTVTYSRKSLAVIP